jgi:hypothetical protein
MTSMLNHYPRGHPVCYNSLSDQQFVKSGEGMARLFPDNAEASVELSGLAKVICVADYE